MVIPQHFISAMPSFRGQSSLLPALPSHERGAGAFAGGPAMIRIILGAFVVAALTAACASSPWGGASWAVFLSSWAAASVWALQVPVKAVAL